MKYLSLGEYFIWVLRPHTSSMNKQSLKKMMHGEFNRSLEFIALQYNSTLLVIIKMDHLQSCKFVLKGALSDRVGRKW